MTKYREYDFDNPVHRRRYRRPPPPIEGEILEPDSEPHIRVTVEHRHVNHRQSNILPRLVTIAAIAYC
jgi:hypothetical protein